MELALFASAAASAIALARWRASRVSDEQRGRAAVTPAEQPPRLEPPRRSEAPTTAPSTAATVSRQEVVIVDRDAFATLRRAIVAAGPSRVVVVIDFDRTMTTYWAPGRRHKGKSCHGIVESDRSEELKARADALNHYYYPIEVSPELTREQKLPFMVEWYLAVNRLLIDDGLRASDIPAAVARSGVVLREGVLEVIRLCEAHGVPLLVFSAGIGDVIAEVLRQALQRPELPSVVEIVSNWMVTDATGRLTDWSEPLLHMVRGTNEAGSNI
jgi:HAD superfamily hydrolase (TIGR01544 family)